MAANIQLNFHVLTNIYQFYYMYSTIYNYYKLLFILILDI